MTKLDKVNDKIIGLQEKLIKEQDAIIKAQDDQIQIYKMLVELKTKNA
jgi:hypothetical protein